MKLLLTDKELADMKRTLDSMNQLVYDKIIYEVKDDKRMDKKSREKRSKNTYN